MVFFQSNLQCLFPEYISEVERTRITDEQEAAAEEFSKTESVRAQSVPEVWYYMNNILTYNACTPPNQENCCSF